MNHPIISLTSKLPKYLVQVRTWLRNHLLSRMPSQRCGREFFRLLHGFTNGNEIAVPILIALGPS